MQDSLTPQQLGNYLKLAREAAGLTLREVEEKTGRIVKNGYLSQIENGAITRPSPRILYELAQVYGISYGELLVRAGHRVPEQNIAPEQRAIADLPLRAFEGLDAEDRQALIEYAAFLRHRKRAHDR
jgi:transcriptional regulator with XRE-family HTH domain